jgi:hypothetical protein
VSENPRGYRAAGTTDGTGAERLVHDRVAALRRFGPDDNHLVAQRGHADVADRCASKCPDECAKAPAVLRGSVWAGLRRSDSRAGGRNRSATHCCRSALQKVSSLHVRIRTATAYQFL